MKPQGGTDNFLIGIGEGDTLGAEANAIAEYAKASGFTVFPARTSGTLNFCTFRWDNRVPWKDFINTAKKQGVSIIVEIGRILTSDDLNAIKTFEEAKGERCSADNYDYCQHAMSKSIDYKVLEKNVGKVGFFSVLWIDGICCYSLERIVDWFKPVAAYFVDHKEGWCENNAVSLISAPAIQEDPTDEDYFHQHHFCHHCRNRTELIGLPKGLRERTIIDLAQEYVDYIKSHAPDLGVGMRTYIRDMFWEEKGVHRNALSSAARFLTKSVEVEASKILKRLEQEQENERMPAVVENCVEWCKQNGISKLTLKALGTFTSAKRIRLSVNNRDILFLKVSSRLAQPPTAEGSKT